MRILVTGAGGALGRAFLEGAPTHHDVQPFAHADLDVGDHDAVMRAVLAVHPDAIVNCGAFTKVDANESEPDRAFRDNALGPKSLALAARAVDAALLHVSTDYVFDGQKGSPYDEADRPSPISVYGRAKLLGERMVRETLPEHLIVRTGYVFGGGPDHLTGAVRALAAGEDAGGLSDRTGSPTFVRHLANQLLPLLLTHRWGTYHVAGPEPTTWFDVLCRCKSLADLPGSVVPQRAVDLQLPAPRPKDSALRSVLLAHLPLAPMPSLDEGLQAFLSATL